MTSPFKIDGAFDIVAPLGGGRYAEVFRARSPCGNTVVVKLARMAPLTAEDATNAIFFAKGCVFHTGSIGLFEPAPNDVLVAEAGILVQCQCPALVKLLDQGEHVVEGERRRYLVLEYLEGRPLRERLELATQDELLGIVQSLLSLSEVLSVHGDIKPDNIILDADGRARFIDPSCGMTVLGPGCLPERLLVTPLYNPVFHVSDIPAIGLTLLEAQAGHPFLDAHPTVPGGRATKELANYLEELRVLGRWLGADWMARMRLPGEAAGRAPSRLETVGLSCLGLEWDGHHLGLRQAPNSVAEVLRALIH